jgi:GT2 family glycosyltransferase
MDKQVQVSFITVNYNGIADTIELVHSIQEVIHSVEYEIIIVDNASRNNEALLLQKEFPELKIIQSRTNGGFACGNNIGIRHAVGRYLFLINNDTFIKEDHLSELIQRMEEHPGIGGISPLIRFAYPPQNVQYAGFTPLSSITLRNKGIGYGEQDDERFHIPHPTSFLHGAAMMIKKEVVQKVGMMSEQFFLYYEEMDWCTRIINAGYELWYDPVFTVFHKESQSTGKSSNLQVFYLTRNRMLYAWRNLHGINRILSLLYLSTIAALKSSVHYCMKGCFQQAFIVFRAMVAFIKLPSKLN